MDDERFLDYLEKLDQRRLDGMVRQLYNDTSLSNLELIVTHIENDLYNHLDHGITKKDLDRIFTAIWHLPDHKREPARAKAHLASAGSQLTTSLERPAARVPRFGEEVACLLVPRADSDATVGDLEEKFQRYVIRYGQRYAVFWYWWQVGSLIRPRIRNMLLWLGGLAGLKKALDWIGKLGGS